MQDKLLRAYTFYH